MLKNAACGRKGRTAVPWLLVAYFAATLSAWAATERGYPLITVFPAEAHKAGPQTFDLAQDARGVFYFGNLHGLLTFDGAWWRLQSLPDDQSVLALAANREGMVALGLVNDLGYLAHNASGLPEFRSLLPLLPEGSPPIHDVTGICAADGGFLFVTDTQLLLWNGTALRSVPAGEPAPRGCHADEEGILLRGPGGLLRFDTVAAKIGPPLVDGHVVLVIRDARGRMIVALRDQGLFVVDPEGTRPFALEASEWLKDKSVTSGARLPDGRLAIATRRSGIVILDPSGGLEQIIGPDSGLPDAVLHEVTVDREGALWAAMEGPIVRIDLASPVTVFDGRSGLRGMASDVVRHRGRLYAGSSHGLHVIEDTGFVRRIDGLAEGTWKLATVGDELLIGTEKGIYRLDESDRPQRISAFESEVHAIYQSPSEPSRVWVARGDGLGRLRKLDGGWADEGLLPDGPRYISSLAERGGVLWAGSVFSGIVRIEAPYADAPRIQQFGSGEMNVFEFGDELLFVRATGAILELDRDRLAPHSRLGHIWAPRGFFLVMGDIRGNLWINSTPPRVFTRLPNGTYAREGRPLVAVTATDIQTMRLTEDGVIWFASDRGLFRYAGQQEEVTLTQPAPLVRRVIAGDSRVLFAGGAAPSAPVELNHDFGRIRIEFAPASFLAGVSYQHRLDPIDGEWSEWSDEPFLDYTSLRAGDYTFRLRARGPSMLQSGETQWSFVVRPPWYFTRWAWALWLLLSAGAIAVLIRVRTAALQRQAERLRTRVAEQTAELQDAVRLLEEANLRLEALTLEDELTGIANRRYFERALADEWNRALRHQQPLALVLLDLDHFKDLNDRLGHPAGDECLRRIGALLAERVRRSGEVVARYGGEEFAILLPGASAEGATAIAEAARQAIEQLSIRFGVGTSATMTTSCGVASLIPSSDSSPEHLVASADRALYAAKHSGRNCVRVSHASSTGSWLHDATG